MFVPYQFQANFPSGLKVGKVGSDDENAIKKVWSSLRQPYTCMHQRPERQKIGTLFCHPFFDIMVLLIVNDWSYDLNWDLDGMLRKFPNSNSYSKSRLKLLLQK